MERRLQLVDLADLLASVTHFGVREARHDERRGSDRGPSRALA
jgi:hypothetical protein